jgi:hypothetical protein
MKNTFKIPTPTELKYVQEVLNLDSKFLSIDDWKVIRGMFSYSFYMANNAMKVLFKALLKSLGFRI